MPSSLRNLLLLLFWIVFLLWPPVGQLWSQEPADRFLTELRERGYFDVALDYLDKIEQSDMITEEYRKLIPFERAETLIDSTRALRDLNEADRRLNQAHQLLVQFSAQNENLETAARVARYQGNLFFRRARISLAQASSERLMADERSLLRRQAREFLQETRQSLLTAKENVRELIDPRSPKGIKIDPQDPSTGELLKKFQRDFVGLRLDLARSMAELADTYDFEQPERSEYLKEAIEELSQLQTAYRGQRHAAREVWQARLLEASCYQKLGKPDVALRLLSEVFEQPGLPRQLKKSAFLIACDSWGELEKYPAREIVRLLEPVVGVLSRDEQRDPDWLRIQMEFALAQYRQGEALLEEGGNRARNQGQGLQRQAGRLLRTLSRIPGPQQTQAREWLAQWNVPLRDQGDTDDVGLPQSFDDLRNKARDNLAEMELLRSQIRELDSQTVASSAQSDDQPQELDDLRDQLSELASQTLELAKMSQQWIDEDTTVGDKNLIRYMQCFSYFVTDQFLEAALIGEFMFQKFPSVDWTRPAMNWVIQSKAALYREANPEDGQFERDELERVCRAVIDRWPGSDESGRAAVELIGILLQANQVEDSLNLFQSIPDSFAAKSLLAIQLGQRLWVNYRTRTASKELDPSDPLARDELDQIRQMLESGLKGAAADGRITYPIAVAGRLLVEAYLEQNQWQSALEGLEGTETGPLDLVKQKHPAVFDHPAAEAFVRETYRLALRVYLAAMQQSNNPGLWVERIKGVLAAMRQNLKESNDPQQQAILSQTYSLIAAELLKQFEAIDSIEEKRNYADDMLSFLGSIEQESNDARTVLWAGSTALQVAQSLISIELADDARPLFQRAVAALSRAEEIGFADDPQRDAMLIELQRQRGLALRGSQEFEAAMEQFIEILKQQPQNVRVQINAAETLQDWGMVRQRSRSLAEAIKGTHRWTNPQTRREANLVWGWENLARATRGKNDELFYQALYHWTQCRLHYGIMENSTSTIAAALREIENEQGRNEDMGGAAWKRKFDQLKQQIQQLN